jgi:heat shock protein HslJ
MTAYLLLGVFSVVVVGCTGAGGTVGLEGTTWILSSFDGQPPLPGSTITAIFESDGKMGGSSGCNSYGASYRTSGDGLTISDPFSTMMACEPDLMEQETDFLSALTATASFVISGETLTLKDAAGASRLVFQAQSTELSGTSWSVVSYNNGSGGVVSVLAGTDLTADFGSAGQLSGNAGCNTYNASYTTDGGAITIGAPASTRMFCAEPEGVMDQEAQYLAALETAARYSVNGPRLELRTADGALAVSLQAAQP